MCSTLPCPILQQNLSAEENTFPPLVCVGTLLVPAESDNRG